MAKFTLHVGDDYPFTLWGINTTLKGYRFAWNINKLLELHMVREEPLTVVDSGKEKLQFGYFSAFEAMQNVHYRLIENRSGARYFLPEQPKADYLFTVDHSPLVDAGHIGATLRSIKGVSAIFIIDIKTLKSKQNLLLTA